MNDLQKPLIEMSDEELLTLLMRSELLPNEKARVVLAVRERKATERHNNFLIILTVVVTLATLVQAIGVARSFFIPEPTPTSYTCHSGKKGDGEAAMLCVPMPTPKSTIR